MYYIGSSSAPLTAVHAAMPRLSCICHTVFDNYQDHFPDCYPSHVVSEEVWWKKAHANSEAFRSALEVHRQATSLHENKENIPPKNNGSAVNAEHH